MPRTCTVCTHAEREAIDQALLGGEAFRNIAKRFATSPSAMFRHKREHIPLSLAKANEARESAHGDSLLDQVQDLQSRTMAILDQAEEAGDLRTALAAIGQAKGVLSLLVQVAPSEEQPEPDDAATFTLNQLFVGAPQARLTPMSDGTYPPMKGYIQGRRIPLTPDRQIAERGVGPWGPRGPTEPPKG